MKCPTDKKLPGFSSNEHDTGDEGRSPNPVTTCNKIFHPKSNNNLA
jgi:hypothetical protein